MQNKFLDKLIYKLWNLILKCPIIKEKYVFRYIDNDYFINNLKINDVYTDNGFLSTTRNQFYDTENSVFGLILLKIRIPKI